MECKVNIFTHIRIYEINWNISRMECKGSMSTIFLNKTKIGIYPEWNVKVTSLSTKAKYT